MNKRPLIDVSALEDALQVFADERDWNPYHSPKNLAMAPPASEYLSPR